MIMHENISFSRYFIFNMNCIFIIIIFFFISLLYEYDLKIYHLKITWHEEWERQTIIRIHVVHLFQYVLKR